MLFSAVCVESVNAVVEPLPVSCVIAKDVEAVDTSPTVAAVASMTAPLAGAAENVITSLAIE